MDSGSRERFETQLVTGSGPGRVVASQWKELGAQVTQTEYTPAQSNDREYAASYTGGWVTTVPTSQLYSDCAGDDLGKHFLDVLLDRVAAAIDTTEYQTLMGQILQVQIGELIVMPLFWDTNPVLQLKSVRSHAGVGQTTTWNFFEFDKE